MYEAFFSLDHSPFVLTPDPRFLLRSKGHHEILATLLYGITSQKGLMALIGDVGTGKTTLCRALLRELPKDVQSALVLNPHLSDVELVGTILDDLGVERRGSTKGELMGVLSQYLLAAGGEGSTVVVILDEAQQMSVDALEQIRILSNLETATRKLLQIVLVGQPELEEKLRLRELRQLDQRIGVRCYLKPLTRKETFRYIEHRLRIAGLPGPLPFTRAAMARIYKYSRGIPRVINLACDRALMAGFSVRAREITPAMVKTAIRNLRGERGGRRAARSWTPSKPVWRGVAAAALVIALGVGAAAAYRTGWPDIAFQLGGQTVGGPAGVPATVMTAATPASPAPTIERALPAGSTAEAPAAPPRKGGETPGDGVRGLLLELLRIWGVKEELSEATAAGWPVEADGAPDIPVIAGRYQLAATFLPITSLDELRAIGLPALIELTEGPARGTYLLSRMEGNAVVLRTPTREEIRFSPGSLEPAWTRTAWVLWRNVDLLPVDPTLEMSPTVLATLALRLQKLGHLSLPLPTSYDARLQQAVRRFQRAMGLREDGIVGPRTTLALSRVVGGRFNPSIIEGGASR